MKTMLAIFFACVGASLHGVMSEAEARAALFDAVGTCVDDIDQGVETNLNADAAIKYSGIMMAAGWNRERLLCELRFIATNRCDDIQYLSNSRNVAVFNNALMDLVRSEGSNSLQTVEFAFRNCAENAAYYAMDGYVDVAGLSRDAFETYSLMVRDESLSPFRIESLFRSIMRNVRRQGLNDKRSRRIIWLSFLVQKRGGHLRNVSDFSLKHFWPEYATSSNRVVDAGSAIEEESDVVVTNYFTNVRNFLLSLPPSTMQMLSTNQFYNVED